MKYYFILLSAILLFSSCAIHPPGLIEGPKDKALTPNQKIISELKQNSESNRIPIKNSVGIIPFRETGEKSGLGLAATEFFTSNLSLVDQFQLIDMSYSHLLQMEYEQFSPEKKRRALKAEQLVRGNIILAGDNLDVAGYDYHANVLDFSEFAYKEGAAKDFFRLVADLNIAFFEKNGITVDKALADKLYRIPTEKMQAYILYARARYYEYIGNFELAKSTYQEVSEIDPQMKEVEEALDQIEGLESEKVGVSDYTKERGIVDTFADPEPAVDQAPSYEEKNVPVIAPSELAEPPDLPERQ